MNRLLLLPLALAAAAAAVVVAVVVTRDSGPDGADVAGASGGVRAWIDNPLGGSEFPLGQTIAVRWHASAAGGIGQVEVLANGERVALSQDFDHSAQIVSQRHQWTPAQAGEYLIQVTATGADAAGITITVQATAENRIMVVGPTTAVGPPPTGTPVPSPSPAVSPVATATPRPGDTQTPPPIGDTPIPIPTPTASATPRPTRTATPVPPTSTPTPDTQGPPAPNIVGPKNDVVLPCFQDVILDWDAPADPSGIASYRVRLQVGPGPDWADVKIWDPVTDTQVNANAETFCGGFYRWRVLARDGVGNAGEVSPWAQFSIVLE